MRIIVATLFPLFLFAKSDLEVKIDENRRNLELKIVEQKTVSSKIDEVAQKITDHEKILEKLATDIIELDKVLNESKAEFEEKDKNLKALESQEGNLVKQRQTLERDIINLVAKEVSLSLILANFEVTNTESLMYEAIYEKFSALNQKDIKKVKLEFEELQKKIAEYQSGIKKLKVFVDDIKSKKDKLLKLKSDEVLVTENLKKEREGYKQELIKIAKEQEDLSALLNKLNIIKKDEEVKSDKYQKEEQKRLAPPPLESLPKEQFISKAPISPVEREDLAIRLIGSSYQNVKTTKYKGEKTISPIEDYKIVKRYGSYIDPIYKIKVFNESVTFAVLNRDTKVKTVLDGKVVFAKDNPLLKNVVIIEHDNNLHTIYASLDKIAPTISAGKIVKKGYVIGRVNSELTFEVTQKNFHINPLELIGEK